MAERNDFIAFITRDGIITARGTGTTPDINVGYDNEYMAAVIKDRDEISSKYLKLYDEAIAAGIRKKPKTPEQLAEEQAEINIEILKAIKELRGEIENLKNPAKGIIVNG